MGFNVKWVEDNLGVSRKALRNFEKMGLMPQNEDGKYRNYSEEDVEYIWQLRILQGMGYSLREIVDMANDKDFNFETSFSKKIEQLEQTKINAERYLGYVKTIKLTGRFPSHPKVMGTIRFDDLYKKSLNEWNSYNDPQAERLQSVVDMLLTEPKEEKQDAILDQLLDFFETFNFTETHKEAMMNEYLLIRAMLNRTSLGADHPEVQLLVKLIYENQREIMPELEKATLQQFTRFYSTGFMSGDIARINENKYGKENCTFIADAIAIFGGYTNSNDPEFF